MTNPTPGAAVLENVRIGFRNFRGEERQYNRAGDRNFAIFLEPEIAEQMAADGWNVKYLKQREDEEYPQAYLKVNVKYQGRPPQVVLVTSRNKTVLEEDMVGTLDFAALKTVDVILNPYAWEVQGNSGITAYLKSGYFVLEEDELSDKYGDIPEHIPSEH